MRFKVEVTSKDALGEFHASFRSFTAVKEAVDYALSCKIGDKIGEIGAGEQCVTKVELWFLLGLEDGKELCEPLLSGD